MQLDMTILASVIAFISIFLLIIGISSFFQIFARKGEVIEKIRSAGESFDASGTEILLLKQKDRDKKSLFHFLSFVGKRLGGASKPTEYANFRLKFLHAGIRHPNAPYVFWGVKLSLALTLLLGFLLVRVAYLKILQLEWALIIGLALVMLGLFIPEIWLRLAIDKRKEQITKGLPDMLDLLVLCVEAGMGLDSALHKVAAEIRFTNPQLSEELGIVNLETRAGRSREAALKNLALRTGLEEVSNLVKMMIQSDRFGTSTAKALRVYSDTFRAKRFAIAEERAAKIMVKLLFPLIFFIFPSLFIVIIGPGIIQISKTLFK